MPFATSTAPPLLSHTKMFLISQNRVFTQCASTIISNNAICQLRRTRFPPVRSLSYLNKKRGLESVLQWCLPQVSRRRFTASTATGAAGGAPPSRPANTPKPEVSPHVGFYHLFGRPIAKVLLMAMITYQGCYWLWIKLEAMEQKSLKQEEVAKLEAELERMRPKKN